jgi:hypothetical protein
MDELESLNHTKWECKYHIVFIPKCRRKTLYVQLRQYLGEVFRKLAEQKVESDRGGAFDVRPCPHDDLDPAEIRRVAGGRLRDRSMRSPISPGPSLLTYTTEPSR